MHLYPPPGPTRRRGRSLAAAAICAVTVTLGLTGAVAQASATTERAQPPSAGAARSVQASTSRAQPGRVIRARVSDHPRHYTRAELAQLNERLLESEVMRKGKPAPLGRARALNPGTVAPDRARAATSILRDSAIPASAINGGANFASSTQEPSTDANGANIFQTGNWYATRSTDNGATWTFLDPFTLFGGGFCCDQVTQYDPATGRQFWLAQYDDHLVIANASATGAAAFTDWCYWSITPTWFGLPAGTAVDYNDITITNTFVNISTNYFGATSSGAALVRLPKVPMTTCSGFNFSRINRSDNFTFKLVPGSTDTLYFASNWGQNNGSTVRVFAWPEASNTYTWFDRTVATYAFYTRNNGQDCASRDGVVTNWCQFADSRLLGAYRAGGVLGFSLNAKQDAAHPFPYTRLVYFRESDRAYLGSGDLWGSWGAIQFLSLAPNSLGRIGGAFTWGGGTGTTHYYPGAATYSTAPTSVALDPNYFLRGQGNTCTYNGLFRWGDYLTVRTYRANPALWLGSVYAIRGGHCGTASAYVEPHNVLFS